MQTMMYSATTTEKSMAEALKYLKHTYKKVEIIDENKTKTRYFFIDLYFFLFLKRDLSH